MRQHDCQQTVVWDSPRSWCAPQDGEEELQRIARHTARACTRAQAVVERHTGCEGGTAAQPAEEASDRRKRRRFSSHPPGEAPDAEALSPAAAGQEGVRVAQPSSREPLDAAAVPSGSEQSPSGRRSPQHAAPCRTPHSSRQHASSRRVDRSYDQHHYHHAGSGRREHDRPPRTRRHHADWLPEPTYPGHALRECRRSRDMSGREGLAFPVHAQHDLAGWEDRWQMSD